MGEHTPGPWKIVSYGDGDSLVICEQDDSWRICFMATPGDSPAAWQSIKANARLIAAAPELLEALKGLLATHKQGRGQCCEAADRAIDAIAKATGAA